MAQTSKGITDLFASNFHWVNTNSPSKKSATMTAIAILIAKNQLLTRPNVLIVLLEYISLFNIISDNMKQSYGRGCPVVYHSKLLYFILSMATVANKVHFAQILLQHFALCFCLPIFLKIMHSVHPYTYIHDLLVSIF